MKIGILQTGKMAPELAPRTGEYPAMFERLLAPHGFDFQTWAVVDGDFPEGPEAADGWLITGSKHGAYEDHPWIPPLEQLIRDITTSGKPLIGVCFGHQIIAQALGGRVEKYGGGWSVGPQVYDFAGTPTRLQAWHQDQVTELPEGAEVTGQSDFCRYAALHYPGKATYTVQAHPEFDDAITQGLITYRGKGVVPDDLLAGAQAELGGKLDREKLSARFAHFFRTGELL